MVKIIYNGDVSPGRIKIDGGIITIKKGDILDYDDKTAMQLLRNKNFSLVDASEEEKKEEVKEKEEVFDLDGDGDFDKEDLTIAAKAMAKGRKRKKTIF